MDARLFWGNEDTLGRAGGFLDSPGGGGLSVFSVSTRISLT